MNRTRNIKAYMDVMDINEEKLATDLGVDKRIINAKLKDDSVVMENADVKIFTDYFDVNSYFFDTDYFDPSIVFGVSEVEKPIDYLGSLDGQGKDVIDSVHSIVEFFKQVDMLITQYDLKI